MADAEQTVSLQVKQKKIDNLLNKMLLDVGVFSALGWTAGLFVGLFFHRNAPVRNLLAGVGGSYGFVNNRVSLKHLV